MSKSLAHSYSLPCRFLRSSTPRQVFRPGATGPAAQLWDARALYEEQSPKCDRILREIQVGCRGKGRLWWASCARLAAFGGAMVLARHSKPSSLSGDHTRQRAPNVSLPA